MATGEDDSMVHRGKNAIFQFVSMKSMKSIERFDSQLRHSGGYTLLELIIVIALLGLMLTIAFPDMFTIRDRLTLQTTAQELESAIKLARQLSADEDREYVVELTSGRFSVRENRVGSERVLSQHYPNGIERNAASDQRLVVNRDGLTGYCKFVLQNNRKQKIDVEVHIGTGRVSVSQVY